MTVSANRMPFIGAPLDILWMRIVYQRLATGLECSSDKQKKKKHCSAEGYYRLGSAQAVGLKQTLLCYTCLSRMFTCYETMKESPCPPTTRSRTSSTIFCRPTS